MKPLPLILKLILPAVLFPAAFTSGKTYQEADGLVIMEAEASPALAGPSGDLWAIYRPGDPFFVEGATGDAHLEFRGNRPMNGPPAAPLTYTFTIHTEGFYWLEMRARKRLEGDPADWANDCFVRMEGDTFGPGPNPGDNHRDDAPLEMLLRDTKMYGGNADNWGWTVELDPGGHDNKRRPIYYLHAGSTYTLIVSGRSQRFNIDRIILRHLDVPMEVARNPDLPASTFMLTD
jgi:hypothetical protein